MPVAVIRTISRRWLALLGLLAGPAPIFAQSQPDLGAASPAPRSASPSERPPDVDYDSEPPYDIYERHWRRLSRDYARSRWSSDRRGWYRSPNGWGWGAYRHYQDDRNYGLGDPYFDEGYQEGWRDGRRHAEWEQRAELGREAYVEGMSQGLEAFRHGDYSAAVRHFVRSAKLNQGDPASRIHAAHAMVAIGRYKEALPALRRAFQLQSKIAYLAIDIHRDYGRPQDFDNHYAQLQRAAEEAKDDPALWLLLGYYQYFSGREADALASLKKSDKLAPDDFMTGALLDAAKLSAPRTPDEGASATPSRGV